MFYLPDGKMERPGGGKRLEVTAWTRASLGRDLSDRFGVDHADAGARQGRPGNTRPNPSFLSSACGTPSLRTGPQKLPGPAIRIVRSSSVASGKKDLNGAASCLGLAINFCAR